MSSSFNKERRDDTRLHVAEAEGSVAATAVVSGRTSPVRRSKPLVFPCLLLSISVQEIQTAVGRNGIMMHTKLCRRIHSFLTDGFAVHPTRKHPQAVVSSGSCDPGGQRKTTADLP